ncbi:MAG: ferritin-like domain-containing protein [Candidatus Thiodiazotropha sp.]
MHTDPQILGYLGRALSLELSAVQMYSTQARMTATWGLDKPSARFREEALEEMQHVERIIARMLALGAAPNASQLRPARIGADLLTLLRADLEFELELIQLYANAAQHGRRIGSNDDWVFFNNLLEEEREHAQALNEWIDQLTQPTESRGGMVYRR